MSSFENRSGVTKLWSRLLMLNGKMHNTRMFKASMTPEWVRRRDGSCSNASQLPLNFETRNKGDPLDSHFTVLGNADNQFEMVWSGTLLRYFALLVLNLGDWLCVAAVTKMFDVRKVAPYLKYWYRDGFSWCNIIRMSCSDSVDSIV